MGTLIAKFGDRYLIWSENSDRPHTTLMTRTELQVFHLQEHGYKGYKDLEERLERVERHGTSSRVGLTVEDLLSENQAGPNGQHVSTEEEIVRLYGGPTVEHWQADAAESQVDLDKPMELVDCHGFDPVRLAVAEVVAVRNGAAFLLVNIPGTEAQVCVLAHLSDGHIVNDGFPYMVVRNVPAESKNDNAD